MRRGLLVLVGLLLLVSGTGGTAPHPPLPTATPRPQVTAIPLPTGSPMQPRPVWFFPWVAK